MEKCDGFSNICGRAVVESDLHAPAIFAPRLDHFAAFPDIVGCRFLDINVFARLAGPDGGERMPVIWGDYRDSVNLLVVENGAKVPVGRRLHSGLPPDKFQGGAEERLVGIADGTDPYIVAILQRAPPVEMDCALVSNTDDGDVDAIIGTGYGSVRLGAKSYSSDSQASCSNNAGFEKSPPSLDVRIHRQKEAGSSHAPEKLVSVQEPDHMHITVCTQPKLHVNEVNPKSCRGFVKTVNSAPINTVRPLRNKAVRTLECRITSFLNTFLMNAIRHSCRVPVCIFRRRLLSESHNHSEHP